MKVGKEIKMNCPEHNLPVERCEEISALAAKHHVTWEIAHTIDLGIKTVKEGYTCENCYNDGYGDCIAAEYVVLGSNGVAALLCDGCLWEENRTEHRMDEPVTLKVVFSLTEWEEQEMEREVREIEQSGKDFHKLLNDLLAGGGTMTDNKNTCRWGNSRECCDKPATRKIVLSEWMDDHFLALDAHVCDEHYHALSINTDATLFYNLSTPAARRYYDEIIAPELKALGTKNLKEVERERLDVEWEKK